MVVDLGQITVFEDNFKLDFCSASRTLFQLHVLSNSSRVFPPFGDYSVLNTITEDTKHKFLKGCFRSRHPHRASCIDSNAAVRCGDSAILHQGF